MVLHIVFLALTILIGLVIPELFLLFFVCLSSATEASDGFSYLGV